ncbi:helix-turn-helix domain-containing protein [Acetobacter fallax]|uniref:Helix-turn-helix domain-containing protein n=1 Tax=Acetobacter fallax TaxID=1737473 RepID=A0ABX0KAA1_9PROT|nr:helix-turn-helix transcriptional regulator [Acetobacter fallax]NHO33354.1 helix-turn-helix domain-containing protein [Acetobacter fallax]NHO36974.1 helix-turn-helix domain-containing protein [Acetobacter fallax]
MEQDVIDDFAKNIRYVCGYYKSISDICRKIGVNRSQFSKYISGSTMPSQYILRKICNFFGVDYREIILPHHEFKSIFEANHGLYGIERNNSYFSRIKSNDKALSIYLGYYCCYKISMVNDNKIVKSIMLISKNESNFTVNYIERSPERRHRYKGYIYYVGDRLFINAYDSMFDSELLSIVMYPSLTTKVSVLSGLCLGVASNITKTPNCVRIALLRISEPALLKNAISRCGVFDKGDADLPASIISILHPEEGSLPLRMYPSQIEQQAGKPVSTR